MPDATRYPRRILRPLATLLEPLWELRCPSCGAVFVAKRSDAVTCSSRCKQAHRRARRQLHRKPALPE